MLIFFFFSMTGLENVGRRCATVQGSPACRRDAGADEVGGVTFDGGCEAGGSWNLSQGGYSSTVKFRYVLDVCNSRSFFFFFNEIFMVAGAVFFWPAVRLPCHARTVRVDRYGWSLRRRWAVDSYITPSSSIICIYWNGNWSGCGGGSGAGAGVGWWRTILMACSVRFYIFFLN